ncbi:TDP-N-acetylfucosamine:lipid II N-acetylfucosaminyltransferase [Serratia sp. Tan611]|uniref:TDP-N-acetylfucosamine:lipid II N-acetylfucosaminyltransferase n=1 Tax=Serratia sp. Tan611 TaxID=2773264 RepID=UPI001931D00C|nr:TDP-N-acetylfucosamine:lipid II N-acetylfucosaminyltransferase [Serratia sp. Tan611]CAE1150063.1 4-alpha-L-fucosyltransferase (Fuc4NAc transferase) [Serratia sp. Tan611]
MTVQLKIIHLCPDDKFIDNAINMFEDVFPRSNFVCVYTKGQPGKYVKNRIDYHVGVKDVIFGIKTAEIMDASVVVVHSLSSAWYRTLEKLNKDIPIVWLGWGSDYYDIIDSHGNNLLDKTTVLEHKLQSGNRKGIKGYLQLLFDSALRKVKVIERINYFSPVIPNEYATLKSARKWKSFPMQADWNYSPSKQELSDYINVHDVAGDMGRDILIGNSATSSNNHLEAFDIINKIKVSDRRLVVPLSYGNMIYGREIKNIGESFFGRNFDALIDYMPIDMYMEKIAHCGFVIMNHVRQQAVGNIIIMLYMGAKVFLRDDNPTYKYFKGLGLTIFSIQELERDKYHLESRLTSDEVMENRKILDRVWSQRVLTEKTRILIETIAN